MSTFLNYHPSGRNRSNYTFIVESTYYYLTKNSQQSKSILISTIKNWLLSLSVRQYIIQLLKSHNPNPFFWQSWRQKNSARKMRASISLWKKIYFNKVYFKKNVVSTHKPSAEKQLKSILKRKRTWETLH